MKRQQKFFIALAATLVFQAILPNVSFAQADMSNMSMAKVSIGDFAFSPATITVKSGTMVTWTNNDSAVHNVQITGLNLPKPAQQIDFPNPPETMDLNKGKSDSITFTVPGTYAYICTYHPGMKGTVIVQ